MWIVMLLEQTKELIKKYKDTFEPKVEDEFSVLAQFLCTPNHFNILKKITQKQFDALPDKADFIKITIWSSEQGYVYYGNPKTDKYVCFKEADEILNTFRTEVTNPIEIHLWLIGLLVVILFAIANAILHWH
jgi:hypothetical protein